MRATGRWTVAAGAGLTLCAGLGAAVGSDAAGYIDRFYTALRVHPERAAPIPVSSPDDGDQPPPSDTTWASATAGQSVAIVGGDIADGSDLTAVDREVERASAVRIHRSRPMRAGRAPVDPPIAVDDVLAEEPSPST